MSDEREERLCKLRERTTKAIAAAIENYVFRPLPTWGDVDFLLSLIDSQTAEHERVLGLIRQEIRTRESDCKDAIEYAEDEWDRAVTQMRNQCVDRVREYLRHAKGIDIAPLINDLKSLSLDNVLEKHK